MPDDFAAIMAKRKQKTDETSVEEAGNYSNASPPRATQSAGHEAVEQDAPQAAQASSLQAAGAKERKKPLRKAIPPPSQKREQKKSPAAQVIVRTRTQGARRGRMSRE